MSFCMQTSYVDATALEKEAAVTGRSNFFTRSSFGCGYSTFPLFGRINSTRLLTWYTGATDVAALAAKNLPFMKYMARIVTKTTPATAPTMATYAWLCAKPKISVAKKIAFQVLDGYDSKNK